MRRQNAVGGYGGKEIYSHRMRLTALAMLGFEKGVLRK